MSANRALIVVVATLAAAAASAEEIVWSPDRPLRWEDFHAPMDANAPPERIALTAASLTWRYDYKVDGLGQECSYRIRGVRAQAVFDPAKSWVRPGHRAGAVLAHEQGHFDITEIFRLKLEEGAAGLLGVSARCEGDTLDKAMASTKRRAAERMDVVFKKIWDEYLSVQQRYDEETQHGILVDAQARWTEAIDDAIRGKRGPVPTDWIPVALLGD